MIPPSERLNKRDLAAQQRLENYIVFCLSVIYAVFISIASIESAYAQEPTQAAKGSPPAGSAASAKGPETPRQAENPALLVEFMAKLSTEAEQYRRHLEAESTSFRDLLEKQLNNQQTTGPVVAIVGVGLAVGILGALVWHINHLVQRATDAATEATTEATTRAREDVREQVEAAIKKLERDLDRTSLLSRAVETAEAQIRSRMEAALTAETVVCLVGILTRTRLDLLGRVRESAPRYPTSAMLPAEEVQELVYSIQRLIE